MNVPGIFDPYSNKTCRRRSARIASSFNFCCLHVSDFFKVVSISHCLISDGLVCENSMNIGGILIILRTHFIWKASIYSAVLPGSVK